MADFFCEIQIVKCANIEMLQKAKVNLHIDDKYQEKQRLFFS